MIRLAAIYTLTALKNRFREGLRRLKQPRYALGLVALIVYLGMTFGPSLYLRGSGHAPPPALPPRGPAFGIGVWAVALWTLWRAGRSPAIGMQKGELMFLLTAPVTRRQILTFWIVNQQPKLLFSGVGLVLVAWLFRWDPISAWIAYWAAINVGMALSLVGHQICAHALARQRPAFGRSAFWGLLLVLAVVVLLTGARHPYAGQGAAYVRLLLHDEPLVSFLTPAAALRSLFTASLATAAPRAGGLLALAAALYAAACLRPAPFEEASLAQAEGLEVLRTQGYGAWRRHRRARALAGKAEAPPQPFALTSHGGPARAMLWKALIGIGRSHRPRVLATALAATLVLSIVVVELAPSAAPYAAGLTVYALILGWMLVSTRLGLRQEMTHFPVLKSYPLSGRHVLRGSTLAVALVLSSYTLLALAACAVLTVHLRYASGWQVRAPLGVSAWILSFAAAYVLVAIGNVFVVIWPGWAMKTLPKDAGLTQLGTNLMSLFLRMIPFALAWIVPCVVGGLVYFVAKAWLRIEWPWAILCAAVPGAVILVAEGMLILWFGERSYARLDVSDL